MSAQSESKIRDFIQLATMAGDQSGISTRFEPFSFGEGIQIVWLERRNDGQADIDRFLIEITSLADQQGMGLQLSLNHNDMHIKNEFSRYGFEALEDSHHLQMERNPTAKIDQTEFDLEDKLKESAPPGKKAERFINHRKKDFKKRYGKRWKEVLYATAWKQFGESLNFKDYLCLVENINSKFEIFTDGRTVWINASDGSSVGRFGRMGIDIHTSADDQMNGAPQCLACTHERTTVSDWHKFQVLMKQHFDIDIDVSLMPMYLQTSK